jgi:K+-transporting ATPase A subunit
MQITLTWTTIIAAAGGLAALVAIIGYLVKIITWFQRQKQQDKEITAIKEEQQLLTYGVLACLKGLKEQGCNGPVTEAINKIEKHINAAAHAAN